MGTFNKTISQVLKSSIRQSELPNSTKINASNEMEFTINAPIINIIPVEIIVVVPIKYK